MAPLAALSAVLLALEITTRAPTDTRRTQTTDPGHVDGVLPVSHIQHDHLYARCSHTCTLSSDNDPLFRYHRWQANLRILEIRKIKSIPYTPVSHPFVERLPGTIRREYLDRVFFETAQDLENPGGLLQYYNRPVFISRRMGAHLLK